MFNQQYLGDVIVSTPTKIVIGVFSLSSSFAFRTLIS